MGRRHRKAKAAVTDHAAKPEHHHPVHYHAVVDTQWRDVGGHAFTSDHGPIQDTARAFEVTDHPVAEAGQPMPEEIAQQYPQLVELAQLASDAAIARLEMLGQRHAGVTVLNNLLAAAYSRRGKTAQAMAVVERNYKLAPQYLFGRIQYAQMCLATGRIEQVPAIFDHHFDLKLLYPHRRQYHTSEFVAFLAVVAEYHLATGRGPVAVGYYATLKHVAPDHELTRRLGRMLPNAG